MQTDKVHDTLCNPNFMIKIMRIKFIYGQMRINSVLMYAHLR